MTREEFENLKVGDTILRDAYFDEYKFLCTIVRVYTYGIKYVVTESKCSESIESLNDDWGESTVAFCNHKNYHLVTKKKITLKEFIGE